MTDFPFDVITADEYDRQRAVHEPLTRAMRELIDAGIRTDVDEATVREAQAAIEAVTATLRGAQRNVTSTLRHAATGRPLAWANPAVGLRNAIAPPMDIHHQDDSRCWAEFELGVAYEGPPGLVHGGICALVLDHILGEVASDGLTKPLFTGTITLRYLRGTPLGPLRAEAFVERTEGIKTYARGYLGDADGWSVEADGVFIRPAWAREA
ncbi:PaaI family thioesterase [Mycolicibacterium sp.]|uniref:PaaI family thioesterase n=1 Tax=Mycolicibacterium sp. TaxID=2320850 RepID=UPI001A1C7D5C|nr:PaaI family thioesterase [Mycolicibacterium sp.]MBJ7341463.1 PaaI family thioesterase [Mycolicibacterium sp.]